MAARTVRGSARTPATTETEVRPAIRERKRKGGNLVDKYALPDHILADLEARGMTAEWKRETTYGASDPSYDAFLRDQGFEPIQGSRYPEMVMEGYTGPIRRDGLILMERPVELTREAQAEERAAARDAVRIKEQQLTGAPDGHFQRHREDGSSTVKVSRTIESGGIEID